ncbi:MAG: acetyl-CoA carboxylase biotin carboxyl carrier protein [Planctomycetes bacterium]|nr:acetyl-CoA carboxylase biotin carboxyl carrier protein [Planctomycetota bacterium]
MELIKKVENLISLMNENNLAEIEIEEDDTKIRLKKSEGNLASASVHLPAALQAPPQEGSTKYLLAKKNDSSSEIVAPMVGTFYSSVPGAEPYVGVGDVVDTETVVCIIEAMKIMNEVKAEARGKVVEVLVENGDAVEFGQALFVIELEGDD